MLLGKPYKNGGLSFFSSDGCKDVGTKNLIGYPQAKDNLKCWAILDNKY